MTAIPLNVTENSYPFTTISPIEIVEGDAVNFNVNCSYGANILSTGLTNALYRNRKTVSNPATPLTGTTTATGSDNNFLTKTTATNLPPGEYVLYCYGTIDGLARCLAKIYIDVQPKGSEQ